MMVGEAWSFVRDQRTGWFRKDIDSFADARRNKARDGWLDQQGHIHPHTRILRQMAFRRLKRMSCWKFTVQVLFDCMSAQIQSRETIS